MSLGKPPHSALRYVIVWVALLALTGTTFGLSRLDLGRLSLPLSLCIALTKAVLVAVIFMHLSEHRGTVRLTLLTALTFILLLTGFAVADVVTRLPSANPDAPQ